MIFKSTIPDVEIPTMGVYQYVTSNPNKISDDKVIFIDGTTDKKLTYGEIKSKSKKFAAGLIDEMEFKRGDVLAILSPNQLDYSVVVLGTVVAGGKVTFANPLNTVGEFTFQLKDSGAKYIVVFPLYLSNAIEAAIEANIPKSNIFLFGEEEINGVKPYSSLLSNREADPVEYSPEELKSTTTYLCYSSGTTGKNKGVETTHYNMVANLAQIYAHETDINTETSYMGVLPFFHIYGLCLLVNFPLLKGASAVIMPKFDLEPFCKIIQDYKIKIIPVVPPIALSLVKNQISRKYDISSSQYYYLCSAAPLSNELAKEFTNTFNVPIKQCYGLTEASPALHLVKTDDIVVGSIGKPIPNLECKVISENGEELGYNQPGELCVRGPNIMKGYLNNKEATDACIDSERWFHTGDIVTVDESGNFFIVDRVKELIKYKGFQVAPAELESILLSHPSIADAAVVGAYSEQEVTEYPVAYVALRENIPQSDQLKEEIKDFVAQKVAVHKKLRGGVFFVDKIPKNNTGKILRRVLRDRIKTEHPFYRK